MRLTEVMIREKAYELWEASGKPADSQEKHWFAAEALLLAAVGNVLNGAQRSGKQLPPIGLRQLRNL